MTVSNQSRIFGVTNEAGSDGLLIKQTDPSLLKLTATLSSADSSILSDISTRVNALVSDSAKGLLRSLGDAGSSPTNYTGHSILSRLQQISAATSATETSLYPLKIGYSGSFGYSSSLTAAGTTVLLTQSFGSNCGISGATIYYAPAAAGGTCKLQIRNASDVVQFEIFNFSEGPHEPHIANTFGGCALLRLAQNYDVALVQTGDGFSSAFVHVVF
jgi:hypothetical protein